MAIRADSELVILAISSERLIIFDTLIPAAGSNSFKVTTGPLLTFLIFPSTPKSKSIFSKLDASIFESSALLENLSGLIKNSITVSYTHLTLPTTPYV